MPFGLTVINDCYLFTIALDNSTRSLTTNNSSNNFRSRAESHCKANLIKIPDIIFKYTVFLNS